MIFYYSSLALIFCISALIVRKDICCKKISNKIIIAGFLLGAILSIVGLLSGYISVDYLEKVAVNVVLALAVSFLIWQLGLWPAGDAKFFILISFLLPLYYYRNSYLPLFPSFALLFNIFIAFLIFVIFKSIVSMVKSIFCLFRSRKNMKKTFLDYLIKNKKELTETLKNKKTTMQIVLKGISQIFLAFCFYFITAKFILKIPINFVSAVFFMIIFRFIYACINSYTQKYSRETIKSENIKVGENLDDNLFPKMGKIGIVLKKIGRLRADGLEKQQVEIMKEYLIKNNIKEVVVYKTIPFSIWMVIGIILTIIFSGIVRSKVW
jgi:Flp pilus assembly protein protease CpaA